MLRSGVLGTLPALTPAAGLPLRSSGPNCGPSGAELADAVSAIAYSEDRQAFAMLFRHFAPRIKRYVLKLGASAAEAEEVTQDAMLTVWRKAASFDRARASVSTWVFTIARNRRIDIVRKEKRPDFDPCDPKLFPQETAAPDAALFATERQVRLAAAIKCLPQAQNELVQEAFYLTKTYAEIAGRNKLPLGTVKSRMRLALSKLRLSLFDENVDGLRL